MKTMSVARHPLQVLMQAQVMTMLLIVVLVIFQEGKMMTSNRIVHCFFLSFFFLQLWKKMMTQPIVLFKFWNRHKQQWQVVQLLIVILVIFQEKEWRNDNEQPHCLSSFFFFNCEARRWMQFIVLFKFLSKHQVMTMNNTITCHCFSSFPKERMTMNNYTTCHHFFFFLNIVMNNDNELHSSSFSSYEVALLIIVLILFEEWKSDDK